MLLAFSTHTFAKEILEIAAANVESYRFADVDGDRQPDLVTKSPAGISVYSNQGEVGDYQRRQHLPVSASFFDLVDLNGDENLDLVIARVADGVHWYRNDGHGEFLQRKSIFEHPQSGPDFATADLNNDGDVDVVVPLSNGQIKHVENSNGRGSFRVRETIVAFPGELAELALADIDGDDDVDLLSVSNSGIVWHANSRRRLGVSKTVISQKPATNPSLADLDNDGSVDVLLQTEFRGGAEVVWFRNLNATGSFDAGTLVPATSNHDFGLITLLAGDVDHDGDLDIVTSQPVGNRQGVFWYQNTNGKGEFAANQMLDFDAHLVDVSDANNDLTADILTLRSDGTLSTFDYRLIGDSNHDNFFNSSDIIHVFQTGHYEDDASQNSTFDQGDWNGDRDFDTDDLIFVFQAGTFENITYPRLFFGPNDIPVLRQKLKHPKRAQQFARDNLRVLAHLETDFSDAKLTELSKAALAHRMAFAVLMLEEDDPERFALAAKAREILLNINNGTWHGYSNKFGVHYADWDGSDDLHPWYAGGILMDYSLAFDWLVGAGELFGDDRREVRFRILRLAQIEHERQSTPYHLVGGYASRISNYAFRSLGGVGIAALTFPDQTGFIDDPSNRMQPEDRQELDTREVLNWITDELFQQITTAGPTHDVEGQSLVSHYFSSDGVYGEGFTYEIDAFGTLIPFLVSLHETTGVDYISYDGPADGRIKEVFQSNFRVMLPNLERPLTSDAWQGRSYLWHGLMAPYMEDPSAHYWFADFVGTTHFGVSMSAYDDSHAKARPELKTEFLPDAGFAVFRDKSGPDGTYLLLSAQGRPVFGHNQADQGSISLYAHGAHMVIDPGYGRAYAKDPKSPGFTPGGKWNWISSALGHSGVTIDSLYTVGNAPKSHLLLKLNPKIAKSYSEVPDPGSIENTLVSREIDYAEAHVVYQDKQTKLVRAVAFPRHRYFILEDTLTSNAPHQYGWQLQLGKTETGSFTSHDRDFVWTTPNKDGIDVRLGISMLDDNRNVHVYTNGPTNFTGTKFPDDVFDRTYILADQEAQNTKYVTILDPHQNREDQLEIETVVEGQIWKVIHSPNSYDLIMSQPYALPTQFGEIDTDANFVVASIDIVGGKEIITSIFARGGSRLEVGYDQTTTLPIAARKLLHFETPD